jgi:drug/metabolite transporter (DMT)-like permease
VLESTDRSLVTHQVIAVAPIDDTQVVDAVIAGAGQEAQHESEAQPPNLAVPPASPRDKQRADGRKARELGDQALWADEVRKRLRITRASLRHNDKRAMTFGGLALVLSAFGAALLVNKFQAGSDAQPLPVHPQVLGVLCALSAAAIWVARLVSKWREVVQATQSFLAGWSRNRHARRNLHQGPEPVRERRVDPHRGEGWTVLLVASLALATVGGTILLSKLAAVEKPWPVGQGPLGVGSLSAALGLLVIAVYYNKKARRDEQDRADLQFEHDLLRYKVEPFESRAEKLLSVNQVQLRRYYELNLQQARAVFIVGLGCIGAGLTVVGATLWLVSSPPGKETPDNQTQIVVALVGAVGTVLTNYVAAMYFKMYNAISASLVRFHRELAATHDLFFANVLTTGIAVPSERSQTLVKLAMALAERKLSHSAGIDKEEAEQTTKA